MPHNVKPQPPQPPAPWQLLAEPAVIVAVPLLLRQSFAQIFLFPVLLAAAGYCLWRLKTAGISKTYLRFNWAGCRAALPGVLLRAGAGALAILVIVLLLSPERLFCIPRTSPLLMVAIAFGYGLISVLPQEVIFRSYAAWRLDQHGVAYLPALMISSALFGWVHIVFGSALSLALTFAAGLSFYRTYRKHQSLAAVWLEHSLVGTAIFAFGLDHLFYVGPGLEHLNAACTGGVFGGY